MPIVKLLSKQTVAEGTMSFSFEKPAGFTFTPGQYIDVTLINPPETDAEGNTRAFSINTTPTDDHLAISTRMRDTAFKRVLRDMPIGTEFEISDAMGSFTLHKNTAKPAVFLMGGIGITPTLSMVRDAAKQKLPHHLFLFYSNRRPEDAAFLDELEALQKENPNYTFIPTMTDMDKSAKPWSGETGYISAELIHKHIAADQEAVWYISGPPAMVKAMRDLLTEMKVDEDSIKTEEFSGY